MQSDIKKREMKNELTSVSDTVNPGLLKVLLKMKKKSKRSSGTHRTYIESLYLSWHIG